VVNVVGQVGGEQTTSCVCSMSRVLQIFNFFIYFYRVLFKKYT
jgi:hypothetical protein